MAFNRLRLEYSLAGNLNFIAWKDLMEGMLDDNGLLDYFKRDILKPRLVDAQNLSQ